jgi:hypothetical protein
MSTHILRHPTPLSGATRLTADWSNKGGEPDPPRELLRLMPDYHSGLRDYHIWFSMIVPPVEENFDIPLTLRPYYLLTEMGSVTLEGPPLHHYTWVNAYKRWQEYPFLPEVLRTLSPDLPDVLEMRCEVAGRLHDRFCEYFWRSVFEGQRKLRAHK